jgi:hypothetical protein
MIFGIAHADSFRDARVLKALIDTRATTSLELRYLGWRPER